MSFTFNWGRLDATSADALRMLLSQALQKSLIHQHHSQAAPAAAPNSQPSSTCGPSALGGSPQLSFASSSTRDVQEGAIVHEPLERDTSGRQRFKRTQPAAPHASCPQRAASHRTPHQKAPVCPPPPFVIEDIDVTDLRWGQVPPFIELVSLSDALVFDAPGAPAVHGAGMTAGTAESASAAAAAAPVACMETSCSTPDVCGATTSHRMPPQVYPVGAPSLTSSFTASDCMSRQPSAQRCPVEPPSGCGGQHAAGVSEQPRKAPVGSVSPAAKPSDDALAAFFGPKGLFLKAHITYGGNMSLQLRCTVRAAIPVVNGVSYIHVRLPIEAAVSHIGIDGLLNVNLHANVARVWLEPTALSETPITKLGVVTSIGSDSSCRRPASTDERLAASTARSAAKSNQLPPQSGLRGAVPVNSSSAPSPVSPFVDERAVAAMILAEVKGALQRHIVFPHYVQIPLAF